MFILSRDVQKLRQSSGAQAIIAGTYTVADSKVYVNVRIMSASDGRVLAAHDYTVEKNENVRYLLGRDAKVRWY